MVGGEVPSSLSEIPAEHNALAAALLQNFLQHLPAPLIGPEISPLLHEAYKGLCTSCVSNLPAYMPVNVRC
jgi:hypothetical protein